MESIPKWMRKKQPANDGDDADLGDFGDGGPMKRTLNNEWFKWI